MGFSEGGGVEGAGVWTFIHLLILTDESHFLQNKSQVAVHLELQFCHFMCTAATSRCLHSSFVRRAFDQHEALHTLY